MAGWSKVKLHIKLDYSKIERRKYDEKNSAVAGYHHSGRLR
jgi:hypothetical protein